MLPVNRGILVEAARIRASSGPQLRLPDAIHIATAHATTCQAVITNDKRLKAAPDLRVMLLTTIIDQEFVGK